MMKKTFLYILLIFLFACKEEKTISPFISVDGTDFILNGENYVFMGANLWYGMNLGSEGKGGNRNRLIRELDKLQSLGIKNLRIMGSSEGSDSIPYRSKPALLTAPGIYDNQVLEGLDFLLVEMSKRNMKAVVCMNNFWMWSGGFPQYISWADGSEIPFPDIEGGGTWDPFINYSMGFYTNKKANDIFYKHLEFMITRKNSVSGVDYKNDPTIMAWQLSNEPRGYQQPQDYRNWLSKTAKLIKSLDQNHLVCIGSEGNTNSDYAGIDLYKDNNFKEIDYCTTHIWVQNWGWFDPSDTTTFSESIGKSKDYLASQIRMAELLGKPLVIEEFGVSRDSGQFNSTTSVKYRDSYYKYIFETTIGHIINRGIVKGCNFWSWAGEGTPSNEGKMWQVGDDFIGDPPHERQGWYSVYSTDGSTIEIIEEYGKKISEF